MTLKGHSRNLLGVTLRPHRYAVGYSSDNRRKIAAYNILMNFILSDLYYIFNPKNFIYSTADISGLCPKM